MARAARGAAYRRIRQASLLAVVILLLPAARAQAGEGGGGIEWTRSFGSAMELSRIEQRIVMINFYTTWCHWCRRLEAETYTDPSVIRLSRGLACVTIDAERDADLARRYGARAFPTIVFVDPSGKLIEASRGFLPAARFCDLLTRILDRSGEEFILKQRLKDHPDLIPARVDLARLLIISERYDEADSQYDALADLCGGAQRIPWRARFDRARLDLLQGRAKEAQKEFAILSESAPDDQSAVECLYFLGEAYLRRGDRKGARREFRRLLASRSEGWLSDQARIRLEALE